jgi:hypothetical protein
LRAGKKPRERASCSESLSSRRKDAAFSPRPTAARLATR